MGAEVALLGKVVVELIGPGDDATEVDEEDEGEVVGLDPVLLSCVVELGDAGGPVLGMGVTGSGDDVVGATTEFDPVLPSCEGEPAAPGVTVTGMDVTGVCDEDVGSVMGLASVLLT